MCISTVLTRDDLFALRDATKFYIENENEETVEGIKIAQHTTSKGTFIIADFPELGQYGESVILEHSKIEDDGSLSEVPAGLIEFGEILRLCCEGRF